MKRRPGPDMVKHLGLEGEPERDGWQQIDNRRTDRSSGQEAGSEQAPTDDELEECEDFILPVCSEYASLLNVSVVVVE